MIDIHGLSMMDYFDLDFDITSPDDGDNVIIRKVYDALKSIRNEMYDKYWCQYQTYDEHGIPEGVDISALIKDRDWWEHKFEEARDIMTSIMGNEQDYTEYDIFRSTFIDKIDKYRKKQGAIT